MDEKLKQMQAHRDQLPQKWQWSNIYELTGRHWALQEEENAESVVSLGLVSHDHYSTPEDFRKEPAVTFVENSLAYFDDMMAEINRLRRLWEECSEAIDILCTETHYGNNPPETTKTFVNADRRNAAIEKAREALKERNGAELRAVQ